MIPCAQPQIGVEEEAAVLRVLRSGMLAQGPEVAAFEEEFAEQVEGRACVAVNSGTSALHLGLVASNVGRGDEVIVPSFSFAASANAVSLAGATPVFVDITADDFCLDPEAVRAVVTARTAAIMAVHLYGQPACMKPLQDIAQHHGLLLIEDAAQAHGASLDSRPAGALGDLAAFSFYPSKNMTTGEGGMIVTPDLTTAEKLRMLRNQGMRERYRNEIVGFNLRLTDIAAAIGRVQLQRLAGWNAQRARNANFYDERLRGACTPAVRPGVVHSYHQYTVRVRERDAVLAHARRRGVEANVYYPVPIHRLPAYAAEVALPETDRAAREVLSLPVHPGLTDQDRSTVVDVLNEAVQVHGAYFGKE